MQNIKTYMAKNGLTHEEMADRIGISRSFLTQIVNQTRFPSRKVMNKIAEVTGGHVPPAAWFDMPAHVPATTHGPAFIAEEIEP
jgi:transcriptional regulator with XRE-family HTH domain